ncbi:unnamed protein product [Discosporangium mesarthrocarpum]
MQPTWLIDADSSLVSSETLRRAASAHSIDVRPVKFFPHKAYPHDIAGAESIARDACAIFTGSPVFMDHIQHTRRWRPGGWCTFRNFACDIYYTYFGQFLLNDSYSLLPAAEAIRQSDVLFNRFGDNGKVFVRPSPAEKLFTGTLANPEQFSRTLSAADVDPRALMVISTPRVVEREWRLIVCQSNIVAASQYAECGELTVQPNCPHEVQKYATDVLQHVTWRPDPIFTMDVCECGNSLHVLELNGFSCSNLYDCDLQSVVAAVTRLATAS